MSEISRGIVVPDRSSSRYSAMGRAELVGYLLAVAAEPYLAKDIPLSAGPAWSVVRVPGAAPRLPLADDLWSRDERYIPRYAGRPDGAVRLGCP